MKRTAKWTVAALVAMVLATAAFAASPKFPSYLIMDGMTVAGVKNQKKLPAELVIPEGATAIGWSAFHDCTSLVSVAIPASVKEIGICAFKGCTSLASVTIAEGVQEIGMAAFEDCASLKEIRFKGTKAQWKAIEGCKLVVISGIIFCSDGNTGVEEFPEYLKIEDAKVTGYTDKVPANLVIPDGVEAIGIEAFQECKVLVNVTIPSSVTEIGRLAFKNCASLASVAITGGVKTIGSEAFKGCALLASMTIGNGVESIGDGAFEGCTSLKEIQFSGTIAQWKALKGIKEVKVSFVRCSDGNIGIENAPEYLKMDGTVVTGSIGTVPENVVIPEGVTGIGEKAFRDCKSLVSVVIPGTVTEIGWSAFRGCDSLASVVIPSSVTEISSYAFEDCASLKEIQFGGTKAQWKAFKGIKDVKVSLVRCSDGNIGVENVPEYLKMDGTVVIGYTSKVPANLVIPEGATGIKDNAFGNCSVIESVTIPGSVEEIGRDAFFNCKSLVSVTVPSSVTEISSYAFNGCALLKEIQFKGTMAQWKAIQGSDKLSITCVRCSDGNIGVENIPEYLTMKGAVVTGHAGTLPANVVIPEGVTGIGEKAFRDSKSLVSVVVPGTVTDIDSNAFSGCTLFKEIQFKGTLTQWKTVKGSDKVKAACIRCTDGYIGIENIPEYLKMDGTVVIGYTSKVPANLVIPDGVTGIKDDAFKNCSAIESVTIPGSVEEIGDSSSIPSSFGNVFSGCTYLKRVMIADGVKKIGSNAFKDCKSLANIAIPGSVEEIGWSAFKGCASLASVTIADGMKKIGGSAFSNCTSLKSVSIPKSVTEFGVEAFSDCTSLANVTISEGVSEIGRYAFGDCTSLKSVTIPGSVKKVTYGAFFGCTSLTSVTIAEGVTEIGSEAFKGCKSLVSVTIPSGVTAIGVESFYGCTSIKSVAIPRGVTTIIENAFAYCKSLASVTIPRSVTYIGKGAFAYCNPNLKIQYDGTKAQWNAIGYTQIKNIQCSDGIVTN